MKTCKFLMSQKFKKQGYIYCGKPAYYDWLAGKHSLPLCKVHGEALAGNFTHELTRITNPEGESTARDKAKQIERKHKSGN